MALQLSPLEPETLPAAVRRLVDGQAPEAVRQATARGLSPLAAPELVTALYQLAQPWLPDGSVDTVAETARRTCENLPDGLLATAAASALDGRILDWLGHKLAGRAQLIAALLGNRATADETFAYLAAVSSDAQLTLIARNEQRLLRHPPIIAALYLNPRTPMSVASRAVELAVRNGVDVDVPGFAEVKAALQSEGPGEDGSLSGKDDAAFQLAAEPDPEGALDEPAGPAVDPDATAEAETPKHEEEAKRETPIGQLSMAAKLRLAAVGGAFARAVLVRDSNRVIALAAVRSPAVNDNEVVRYAGNRGLSEDVIRHIAGQRQFTRLYAVKIGLVTNPKCPLPSSMGFLPFLTPRDLRMIARSKGVPTALAKAAQQLVQKRAEK